MSVTPALALGWIETAQNAPRRPIKNHIVASLTDAINRDEWVMTGDSIKHNIQGIMFDGFHRCTAIVRAKKTVKSLVVFNLPEEAIDATDGGTRRTNGDRFTIHGEKYANEISAACRVDLGFDEDGDWHQAFGEHTTYYRLREHLEQHPEIRDIIAAWHAPARRLRYPIGVLVAFWRRMAEIDEEDADAFWSGVCNGVDLGVDDPRELLRERVLTQNTRRYSAKIPVRILIGLTGKTWNMWRDGRQVKGKNFGFKNVEAVTPLR